MQKISFRFEDVAERVKMAFFQLLIEESFI